MTSIHYIAPKRGGWSHPAGSFARGTRDYCEALDAAGYQVWIDSECEQDKPEWRLAQTMPPEVVDAYRFAKPIDNPDVLIKSVFGIETKEFNAAALEKHKGYDVRILQTTYETTRPSDEVLEALALWDAVFVPSNWNADCLYDAGLRNVHAIPHVVTKHWMPLCSNVRPPNDRVFTYGIVGTWEPRKGHEVAIEAFVRAFKPGEAHLSIKTTRGQDWRPYPPPFEMVNALTARYWGDADWRPHIEIVDRLFSRQQLFDYYGTIDVLLSTSHGEGFFLPGLEAKLAGRRVVATDSGGVREFMTDDDFLIEGQEALCGWSDKYGWPTNQHQLMQQAYGGWPGGSVWFDHNVEDVIVALLNSQRVGSIQEPFDFDRFTPHSIGKLMRAMIEGDA